VYSLFRIFASILSLQAERDASQQESVEYQQRLQLLLQVSLFESKSVTFFVYNQELNHIRLEKELLQQQLERPQSSSSKLVETPFIPETQLDSNVAVSPPRFSKPSVSVRSGGKSITSAFDDFSIPSPVRDPIPSTQMKITPAISKNVFVASSQADVKVGPKAGLPAAKSTHNIVEKSRMSNGTLIAMASETTDRPQQAPVKASIVEQLKSSMSLNYIPSYGTWLIQQMIAPSGLSSSSGSLFMLLSALRRNSVLERSCLSSLECKEDEDLQSANLIEHLVSQVLRGQLAPVTLLEQVIIQTRKIASHSFASVGKTEAESKIWSTSLAALRVLLALVSVDKDCRDYAIAQITSSRVAAYEQELSLTSSRTSQKQSTATISDDSALFKTLESITLTKR
jgi:hypothetical protein